MKIYINDSVVEASDGATLSEVIEANGIEPRGIATAVNGVVVKGSDRESHKLSDGDNILIIKAFYGG